MEFASMEVMRTVAQTCLVRCVLTAVELMELSAAVCVRVVNMTQKAVNEKLFTLPVVGKILASGNGLHAFVFSLLALCLISLVLWCRAYRRRNCCYYNKCSLQQWREMFDLAKTAHMGDHCSRLMEIIESSCIDINSHKDNDTGLTLLLCACLSGHMELVKYLIDKGADTSSVTHDQDTALILAVYASCSQPHSQVELVDLLACRGVNVNTRNKYGDSALSLAALYGRSQLIATLLEYGADPSIPSSSGYLPVEFAGHSGNLKAARLLETNSLIRDDRTDHE